MTSPPAPAGSHPGAARRFLGRWPVAAAVVTLLTGAGLLGVSLLGHQDPTARATTSSAQLPPQPPTGPRPFPSSTRSATPPATPRPVPMSKAPAVPVPAARGSSLAARSVPVWLRIPAIGVSVSLSALGLNGDGTVQVPTRYQQPGWYKLGPTPGQMGSAVILGHVDDSAGPAAFYRLRSLHSGDAVEVGLADGMVAHFVVSSVASYLKTAFPAQLVYAPHGYRALQLVTCGGTFDPATGHYLSNVVAYTAWVATTPSG
jgi:hypothetical protein